MRILAEQECLTSSKAVQLGLFHPDQHVYDPAIDHHVMCTLGQRTISETACSQSGIIMFLLSMLSSPDLSVTKLRLFLFSR